MDRPKQKPIRIKRHKGKIHPLYGATKDICLSHCIKTELDKLEEKYFDLVWYARSGINLYKHRPEVTEQVLNIRAKVEEMYPKEIESYHRNGDFNHGFNSGCLAAFRLISKVLDEDFYILCSDDPDLDDGEKYYPNDVERLGFALDIFPNCDT